MAHQVKAGEKVLIKAEVLEVLPDGKTVKVQIARSGGILEGEIVGGSNNGALTAETAATGEKNTVLEFQETTPILD